MSEHDSTVAVEYRAIPDFPAYRVGDDGSVWSRYRRIGRGGWSGDLGDTWRRLKPHVDKDGYLSVALRKDGKYRQWRIHRLVLEIFVGPCPAGMLTAHNNGVRDDNRLENLRWDTQSNNVADKLAHGTIQRGETHGMSRLKEADVRDIRRRYAAGERADSLAAEFGMAAVTVRKVIARTLWKHVA